MTTETLSESTEAGTKNSLPYRWRPPHCPETTKILSDAGKELGEVFFGELNGKWSGIAYLGKAGKHAWYYAFRSRERMDEKIAECRASLCSHEASKATRAAERRKPHDLVVGDVLSAMWGYEQTNVDYYQVTRTSDRCVWVRPIAAESKETASMQGDCVPRPGAFLKNSKETRHIVNHGCVRIDSVRSASRVGYREVGGVRIYEVSHWTSWG